MFFPYFSSVRRVRRTRFSGTSVNDASFVNGKTEGKNRNRKHTQPFKKQTIFLANHYLLLQRDFRGLDGEKISSLFSREKYGLFIDPLILLLSFSPERELLLLVESHSVVSSFCIVKDFCTCHGSTLKPCNCKPKK